METEILNAPLHLFTLQHRFSEEHSAEAAMHPLPFTSPPKKDSLKAHYFSEKNNLPSSFCVKHFQGSSLLPLGIYRFSR